MRAALDDARLGLIDNWLRHVQDVRAKHRAEVDSSGDLDAQANRLCELNVVEQAVNVWATTVVQNAWRRGQPLAIHAWIYAIDDGLLRDFGFTAAAPGEVDEARLAALGPRATIPDP